MSNHSISVYRYARTGGGECDLLLVRSRNFGWGQGLTVYVRTQIAQSQTYSYVSAAALQIGDGILEVGAGGVWFFNGEANGETPHKSAIG